MDNYVCMYFMECEFHGDFYFRCNSPGNPEGAGHSRVRDRRNPCMKADEQHCSKECQWFVMPSGNPDAEQGIVNGNAKTKQEDAANRNAGIISEGARISDRYTFVPEKGMCKYYRGSESERKKYHCVSPGNPHGPDTLLEMLGASEGADHYRKQCRRCNESGEPPKCDFYPGAMQNDELNEKEDSGVGAIMETVADKVIESAVDHLIG